MEVNTIMCGDVLAKLRELPGECIDCIVTSPPYYGLRDYEVEGQIGHEEHPQKYIDMIVSVCDELMRVLKKTGTFWLNLGDSYYGGGLVGTGIHAQGKYITQNQVRIYPEKSKWCQPKQRMLIPERIAVALQDRGWIMRNHIVWKKSTWMPTPVQDRFACSWESIFFFVKDRKYFFDADAIRRPHKESSIQRALYPMSLFGQIPGIPLTERMKEAEHTKEKPKTRNIEFNPLGVIPNDVWEMSVAGLHDAHFAAFPEELPEMCIKAGCPKDGVVLDPFTGSGTTLRVAQNLGRKWLGIDISAKYIEIAYGRIYNKSVPLFEVLS